MTDNTEKRYLLMMLNQPPEKRLKMAGSMFETAKSLAATGLEKKYGPLTERQIRSGIFMRFYGGGFSEGEIKKILRNLPDMESENLLW